MNPYFRAWLAPWAAWFAMTMVAEQSVRTSFLLVCVVGVLQVSGSIHVGRMAIAYQRAEMSRLLERLN